MILPGIWADGVHYKFHWCEDLDIAGRITPRFKLWSGELDLWSGRGRRAGTEDDTYFLMVAQPISITPWSRGSWNMERFIDVLLDRYWAHRWFARHKTASVHGTKQLSREAYPFRKQ